MAQVQSRVNGLIIPVPAGARGVIHRFASKGDNELVFVTPNTKSLRAAARNDDGPMHIETDQTDPTAGRVNPPVQTAEVPAATTPAPTPAPAKRAAAPKKAAAKKTAAKKTAAKKTAATAEDFA